MLKRLFRYWQMTTMTVKHQKQAVQAREQRADKLSSLMERLQVKREEAAKMKEEKKEEKTTPAKRNSTAKNGIIPKDARSPAPSSTLSHPVTPSHPPLTSSPHHPVHAITPTRSVITSSTTPATSEYKEKFLKEQLKKVSYSSVVCLCRLLNRC